MERKSNAGRKKIPFTERKVAATIWVKQKFYKAAMKELLKLQDKYESPKL